MRVKPINVLSRVTVRFICRLTLDGRCSTRKRCSRMLEVFFFSFLPPAAASCFTPPGRETANVLSVSVLIFVSLTDGAADSGELDLSGIDDSEIELVCTCCLMRSSETHIYKFMKCRIQSSLSYFLLNSLF